MPAVWLARALSRLGDAEGAKEAFRLAIDRVQPDASEVRAILRLFSSEMQLAERSTRAHSTFTLARLRECGAAGISQSIRAAQSFREKACERCGGWGYFQWFRDHHGGVC
jgi:hypothetical protein